MKLTVTYVMLDHRPNFGAYITKSGPVKSLLNDLTNNKDNFVHIKQLTIAEFTSNAGVYAYEELSKNIIGIMGMQFHNCPTLNIRYDYHKELFGFVKYLLTKIDDIKSLTVAISYQCIDKVSKSNIKRLIVYYTHDIKPNLVSNILAKSPKLNSLNLYKSTEYDSNIGEGNLKTLLECFERNYTLMDHGNRPNETLSFNSLERSLESISQRNIRIHNIVRSCCYLLLMIKKSNHGSLNYIDRNIWLIIVKDVYNQIYDNNCLAMIALKLNLGWIDKI